MKEFKNFIDLTDTALSGTTQRSQLATGTHVVSLYVPEQSEWPEGASHYALRTNTKTGDVYLHFLFKDENGVVAHYTSNQPKEANDATARRLNYFLRALNAESLRDLLTNPGKYNGKKVVVDVLSRFDLNYGAVRSEIKSVQAFSQAYKDLV